MLSLSTLPVLVMVCHWCCSRPVLSTNGKSSSGSSRGIHVRAGVKDRAPRRGRERQPRSVTVGVDEQVLADAVVEVADRVAVARRRRAGTATAAVSAAAARSWPRAGRSRSVGLENRRISSKTCSLDAKSKCSPKPRCAATWQISCQSGRACPAGGMDCLQQREVALGVDHHGVGLGPQRCGQHDVGVAVGRGRRGRRPG